MSNPTNSRIAPESDTATGEMQRVREQLAARLLNRGVRVHTQDTADALGTLTEAVEGFEAVVEARGGDLMLDEPPIGQIADPDNPAFVLPDRAANESAHSYASRIDTLTAKLQA